MAYTVTEVLPPRDDWSNDFGTYTPYGFKCEGVDKVVVWNRKHQQGSAPAGPKVGDRLEGDLLDKGNYFKFTKAQGSGGGGGGGGKSYDRSPDHPVQMARALHTSALSTAPVLIEQMIHLGVVEKPATKEAYLELVKGVTKWALGTYPAPVREQADKAAAA